MLLNQVPSTTYEGGGGHRHLGTYQRHEEIFMCILQGAVPGEVLHGASNRFKKP